MTPEEVAARAAEIPPGTLPPEAMGRFDKVLVPGIVVSPKGNLEKAHAVVKLLVEKKLLENHTLQQTFELIEQIQKLI